MMGFVGSKIYHPTSCRLPLERLRLHSHRCDRSDAPKQRFLEFYFTCIKSVSPKQNAIAIEQTLDGTGPVPDLR